MAVKKKPANTLEIVSEGGQVTFTIGSESVTCGREEVLNVQRQVTAAAATL